MDQSWISIPNWFPTFLTFFLTRKIVVFNAVKTVLLANQNYLTRTYTCSLMEIDIKIFHEF